MNDENLINIGRRAAEWAQLTNAGLLLRLGEMTAQEIRTVRAVLNAIILTDLDKQEKS